MARKIARMLAKMATNTDASMSVSYEEFIPLEERRSNINLGRLGGYIDYRRPLEIVAGIKRPIAG
jgi:hypothetical protein